MPAPALSPDRRSVLITGFGPFPNVGANATELLVPHIGEAARRALPGLAIEAHVLPTEWEASLALLDRLTDRLQPVLALHFGVSSRAQGFEIETRGRNYCTQSEDAVGRLPVDQVVSPGAPEYLPASLPAQHIVTRLRRHGFPAKVSRDAGGYLCNALLYRSLENARQNGVPERTGFVHLPSSLVNERLPAAEPARPRGLTWADVVAGGVEIVAAALGRPPMALAASGLRGAPAIGTAGRPTAAAMAARRLRPA